VGFYELVEGHQCSSDPEFKLLNFFRDFKLGIFALGLQFKNLKVGSGFQVPFLV